MSKKVLLISAGLRSDSNSECLAQEFAKGAKEAGNIKLKEAYEVGFAV